MKTFLRENGLSVFFATIFGASLAAQSFAGQRNYSAEQREHGGSSVSWWEYVTSVDFWGAVMENWQSEFLQFTVFIGATVWLVQKGSNESKKLGQIGRETDEQQKLGKHTTARSPRWAAAGGFRTRVYENSLLLAMASIFLATWLAQSVNNWRMYNEEQDAHGEATVSWGRYLLDPDFWEKTLQNWQSEFLAVGVMVVFTIFLRQRGSPESKPVGSPHDETGTSG
ncbi:MAG TPA: DUF6766 family protein [Gaiella sp.]|jgi:hypothetical protein|nr:DUF6766 family protein [Gaiella sp.]